jgi:hypothetical protein
MSSASDETSELEQSHADSPTAVPTAEPINEPSTQEPSTRVDRLRVWLFAHPLHVETSLAVISVSLGLVAIPIVVFGALAALGSEPGTPILDAGMTVVVGSLISLAALAVTLLVHAYAEVRHRGLPSSGGLDATSIVYGGTRTLETLTAGTLLLGLLASAASLSTLGSVPGLVGLTTAVAGLLVPTIVCAHAAGTFLRYVFDLR